MSEIAIGRDGLAVRDSGIWVKEKLYYLEHYLDIFSVGMRRKWAGKLYYVDLFAGPGRCLIRETKEEIDGSPLIARSLTLPSTSFLRTTQLAIKHSSQEQRHERPRKKGMSLEFLVIGNEHINQVKPSPSSLGLAFIDPTGISPLAFDTIRKLTTNRKIDLIINFHEGMGIRMNLHQYTRKDESALTTFMGSDRWKQRLRQAPTSFDQTCQEIAKEYLENLRELGYLAFDSERIPIKTDRELLLYYLLFASKDRKGNEFWRKIGLIDPYGQRKLRF